MRALSPVSLFRENTVELLTMRLEGTLSGSVLAGILCSPHEDSKRKEVTMPVSFHCAQYFLCLVILLILILIQVCFHMPDPVRVVFQQLQSPDRERVRESHHKLTLTEQAAQCYETQVSSFRNSQSVL